MAQQKHDIGSEDPRIREYVHDFGLCALNFIYLEHHLRLWLFHEAFFRAKWPPLPAKKLNSLKRKFAEMGLSDALKEIGKLGGHPEIVERLRDIIPARNALMHNPIQIANPATLKTPDGRIAEVRKQLAILSRAVNSLGNTIQYLNGQAIKATVERIAATIPAKDEAERARLIERKKRLMEFLEKYRPGRRP